MDLSKFIDSKAFNTGVAIMIVGTLIIALGGYAWKKRQSLLSKFKSTRLFLFLLKVKEAYLEICQRVLQNRKQGEHGQALDDYVQSFDDWESEDTDEITLSITRGGETRTHYGVIKIHVNNNIIAHNAQDITIIHKKQGSDIVSSAFIEFVIDEDVEKLAKQCYYQKILGTKELKIRWSSGYWDTTL